MSRESLFALADGFLMGGMVGVIVFTLVYGLRSQWWRYIEGIALFAKSATLALISINSVLFLTLGEYPGRPWFRFVSFLLFSVSSWFFVGALVWRQHQAAKRLASLEVEYHEAQQREGRPPEPMAQETVISAARGKLLRWLNR